MTVDERVAALGLEIPEIPELPFRPKLRPVLVHGGLAYISGIGPIGVTGRVGDDMTVNIEHMTALPRSRVGKLRLVVSEIAAASIERPPASEAESARRVTRS